MLYILLTLSLWWRNPSRCGLTTKPLPSHLQGADSPTPTTQNCTFHRAEKRERHREKDEERGERKERKDNRERNSTDRVTNIWLHNKHKRTQQEYHTSRSSYNITYLTPMVVNPILFSSDLLRLMLSEWSISQSMPSE